MLVCSKAPPFHSEMVQSILRRSNYSARRARPVKLRLLLGNRRGTGGFQQHGVTVSSGIFRLFSSLNVLKTVTSLDSRSSAAETRAPSLHGTVTDQLARCAPEWRAGIITHRLVLGFIILNFPRELFNWAYLTKAKV